MIQGVDVGVAGQAAGLFAVTNVDDVLVLALFFARGAGRRGAAARVVGGQYLGFAGIVAVAVAAASGAAFLPEAALPYLGLLPLALGIKAGWLAWRDRHDDGGGDAGGPGGGPGVLEVAAVTFANGGDNIGVYVPVFATSGAASTSLYVGVFLVLVAVWCAAGRLLATRPPVARTLGRWGHVLLPVVLVGIGVVILAGAF